MSDVQALYMFLRKPVTTEMVQFLVSTTNSVIQIAPSTSSPAIPIPSLQQFIQSLVTQSRVQTSTLMSTLVYLNRLKSKIPPNSTGMETTRHRIFLGSLILASKNLNDSSPMNKHWCKYTDGLLTLNDINVLEIEMIDYLGWSNLRIEMVDLIDSFNWFLKPIKLNLRKQYDAKLQKSITSSNLHRYTNPQPFYAQLPTPTSSRSSSVDNNIPPSNSLPSLISSTSTNSINTQYSSNSLLTSSTSYNSISSIPVTTSPTKPLTLKQHIYPPTTPKSSLPTPSFQHHKKHLTPISINTTPSISYQTSNPVSSTSSTFSIQSTSTNNTPTSTTFLKPLKLKSSVHSLRSRKSTESLKPIHHGLRQFKSNSSLKSFIQNNTGANINNISTHNTKSSNAHQKHSSANHQIAKNIVNIPLVDIHDNKENLGYFNNGGVQIVRPINYV